MKKILLGIVSIVAATSLTFSAYGQEQKLSLGFQSNPGISSTQFSAGSKFGLNGGLEVQYQLSNHFSLESGVHYFNRGFKNDRLSAVDVDGNAFDIVFIINRKMITIPATVKFNLNHFYIGAGPNINYTISNQFSSFDGNSVMGTTIIPADDRISFGAQFLIGYNIDLTSRVGLDIEAYYNSTFENLNYYTFGVGTGLRYML